MSDAHRKAILARRSRFVMLALASAGFASSTIDCDGDTADTGGADASGVAGSGGTPQPCLSYPGGAGGFGGVGGAAAGSDSGSPDAVDGNVIDGETSEADGCTDTDPICGPDAGTGVCQYLPDDAASGCVQVTDTIGCPAWAPRLFACAAAVPLHCCINPGITPIADGPVYRCCS